MTDDMIEMALNIDALAAAGAFLEPEKRVECRVCEVTVQQRNLYNHRLGKEHRRRFRRQLEQADGATERAFAERERANGCRGWLSRIRGRLGR